MVVGGTSLIVGFTDRLQRDLGLKTPSVIDVSTQDFLEYAFESQFSKFTNGEEVFELGWGVDTGVSGTLLLWVTLVS